MKHPTYTDNFNELTVFLRDYNLSTILANQSATSSLKTIYKAYHGLLIWHAFLNSEGVNISPSEDASSFWLFFQETVSDLCQAKLLWIQGLYKPSYLVLRSAVENFFRCIGIHQKQAILGLRSTYELIDIVTETKLIKDDNIARQNFDKIRNYYKELCAYVHTSDKNHMSLTTVVGKFPDFEKTTAQNQATYIRNIAKIICGMMAIMFEMEIRKMHHKERDHLTELFPVNLKRRFSGA